MEKSKNAVEALIGILRSPTAERNGWAFDAYECSAWADELEEFLKTLPNTEQKKQIERDAEVL